jgi:hypothetical protein
MTFYVLNSECDSIIPFLLYLRRKYSDNLLASNKIITFFHTTIIVFIYERYIKG